MAIKITKECINCGACISECPNNAIYEGGEGWSFSDGTKLKNKKIKFLENYINSNDILPPKKENIYYIVTEKCTECIGFHNTPQCASVCPVDCCVLDKKHIESKKKLIMKKKFLHNEQ